jgi:tetratricopeptide (TPR) repeat protein
MREKIKKTQVQMRKIFIAGFVFLAVVAPLFAALPGENKLLKSADSLYAKKQYEAAAENYKKALLKNPENSEINMRLGYCYAALGNYANALKYLRKSHEISGNERVGDYIEKMEAYAAKNSRFGLLKKTGFYEGGFARLSGLGSPEIALPDFASRIGLYFEGFSAAYKLPAVSNFFAVTVSPGISGGAYKTNYAPNYYNTDSSYMLGLGTDAGSSDAAVVSFSKNNALLVRPYILYMADVSGSGDDAGPAPDMNRTGLLLGARAEFVQKITDVFSAGAMLGYFFNKTSDYTEGSPDKLSTDNTKLEYFLSAVYCLRFDGPELKLSAGLGAKAPVIINSIFRFDKVQLYAQFEDIVHEHYSRHIYSYTDYPASVVERNGNHNLSVFGTAIGIEYGIPEKFESAIKADITTGFSDTQTDITDTTYKASGLKVRTQAPVFETLSDGFGLVLSGKGRYYFEGLNAGGSVKITLQSFKWIPAPGVPYRTVVFSNLDLMAGGTITSVEGFSIPLEFFMQNSVLTRNGGGESTMTDSTAIGARAGVEYELNRGFKLRLGIEYMYGGTTATNYTPVLVSNSPFGTLSNPGNMRLGFSTGAGFGPKTEPVNVALKFYTNMQTPGDNTVSENSNYNGILVADYKRYF